MCRRGVRACSTDAARHGTFDPSPRGRARTLSCSVSATTAAPWLASCCTRSREEATASLLIAIAACSGIALMPCESQPKSKSKHPALRSLERRKLDILDAELQRRCKAFS